MAQLVLRDQVLGNPAPSVAGDEAAGRGAPDAIAETGLDFTLVRTREEVDALADEWNRLFAMGSNPTRMFQSFNWCWLWCRHYMNEADATSELAIVTGRRNGELCLVMPLVVTRDFGMRRLSWLGEPVSQYGDVLVAPQAVNPAVLDAAWTFAVKATRADFAYLRKVRDDSSVVGLMRQLGSIVTGEEIAPYLALSGDKTFETWEERRKPKARKNRRRQIRRLFEHGTVVFEKHEGTEKAGQLAFAAAVQKRDQLADKGAISPALADPRFAAFFSAAAASADHPAGVSVYTINLDGKPVATKVIVESGGIRALHIAVFDSHFEKCGPGAVLLEHLIACTIDDRLQRLDLLAPRHEYKMMFADETVAVKDHAIAVSWRGKIFVNGLLRQRHRLKAAVEALPAPAKKMITRVIGGKTPAEARPAA
ncbi:MAG: GNAT family N-acetyltransferase [Hyphomicrobiaceae bacterium]